MFAPTVCGHQWVTDPPTHDHLCRRTTPDHRSHECDCSAIELRTARYTQAATLVDGAPSMQAR
jgi:hypothetical protein